MPAFPQFPDQELADFAAYFQLRWLAAVNRSLKDVSRIIPGDWGKVESGWLVQPLSSPDRKVRGAEAEFTSSSGDVRASPVTRTRNLAARND
jgi:hypothetical protein